MLVTIQLYSPSGRRRVHEALPVCQKPYLQTARLQHEKPYALETPYELRTEHRRPPRRASRERRELLDLFYDKILPKKRVEIDVLCHGVTRAALTEQIKSRRGYHIVHWSGHGHYNSLQLLGDDGKAGCLSGEDFVQLFGEAGGFIPQFVFLSACLSGTMVDIKQWSEFQALLLGQEEEEEQKHGEAPVLPEILEQPEGYTGTALALLRCGVPQVLAMRYEVGDGDARRLAVQFYQRLLADRSDAPTEGALALARGDLLHDAELVERLRAVNHATPLMFGQPGRLLDPLKKRSPQMKTLRPKPQPLLPGRRELDLPVLFYNRL